MNVLNEDSEKNLNAFCEDLESYIGGFVSDERQYEILELLNTSETARKFLTEFKEVNKIFQEADWTIPSPSRFATASEILVVARWQSTLWHKISNFLFSWQFLPVFSFVLVFGILFGTTWYVTNQNFKNNSLDQTSRSTITNKSESQDIASETPSSSLAEEKSKKKSKLSIATKITNEEEKEDSRKIFALPVQKSNTLSSLPSPVLEKTGDGGSLKTAESGGENFPRHISKESTTATSRDIDEKSKDVIGINEGINKTLERKISQDRSPHLSSTLPGRSGTLGGFPNPYESSKGTEVGYGQPSIEIFYKSTTISLQISLKNLEGFKEQVCSITKQSSGTFSLESATKDEISLVASIPRSKLESYLIKIRSLGKVEKENIDEKNVGQRQDALKFNNQGKTRKESSTDKTVEDKVIIILKAHIT